MSQDRILLLLIVFVLTVALAASEIARFGQSRNNQNLETRLEAAAMNADAALKAVITPETLAAAEPSVYMVVNDKNHYGSAFVLDRERGILVTAAHVAADLDFEDAKRTYAVINRHSKKPLRIRAKEIHAGFDVFRRIVEDYQPLDPDSPVRSPRQKRVIDIANDAALLFVDPIDPDSGENLLGPDLPLASEDVLKGLKPGDPIAVLGYPIDTITSNIQEDSAAARLERGVISAMLSPIDLVENAGDAVTQNLIVHRMAAAPGNSGGPILNRDGEIIGISSHGHDSLHSNGDSLAQRADVIYDMITPFREQDGLERIYIPDWKERLSNWPKAQDILPYAFYRRYAADENAPLEPNMTIGDLETSDDPPFRADVFFPEFDTPQRRYILHADDLEPEETEEENNNSRSRQTSAAPKQVFLIDRVGEYDAYEFSFIPGRSYVLYAFDYSMAWTSRGYCPLTIYSRRKGDELMRASPHTRAPSLLVKAEKDEKEVRRFNIIIRRDNCDMISKKYLLGVVSWEPEEEDVEEAADQQTALAPSGGGVIRASLQRNASRAENFLNCNVAPFKDDALCEKAIKVQNLTIADENPED